MFLNGNYRRGKHNSEIKDAYKVHKSSLGQQSGRRPQPFNPAKSDSDCKQQELKAQQYGRHPQPFNAAKLAHNYDQAEAKGDARWWNAKMLTRPEGKPEKSETEDIDMETKTVEEHTTDTARSNKLDKNEDKDTPGLEMLPDCPSTNSPMADSPVTMKKGNVPYSSKIKVSTETNLARMPVKDHNANLVGQSYETSTNARHDMDLAKEPVQTSTTADREKEAAREPNKTFITADLGTNPVEPPDNKVIEIKPFNFLGWPDNVRQHVLRCILVSDKPIKPYWNVGALEVAAENSGKENFTTILAAFAGNKKLIDEATTILYGENIFKLSHAKVSLWWLKRIGSNISKIKRLVISVEKGVMDQFGTRRETLWYSIFLLLKAQHKLKYLKVSFNQWDFLIDEADGLDPDKDVYIWEPRYAVLRTLLSFRGLDEAVMKPGKYVSRCHTSVLEEALVLAEGQTNQDVIEFEKVIQGPIRTKYLC